MSIIPNEHLKRVINDIAETLQLKEWTYSEDKFDRIAQNYFGILIPIYLSGKNGKSVNIPMVIKLAPTDERFRVSGALTTFFAKEIYVYSKILHKYQDIQNTFPHSLQFVMPRCYYVCTTYCKEVIALHNMCQESYKPYVHNMFLDKDHITKAVESLGRFHALSYILREKYSTLYEEAKEVCIPLSETTNKRFFDILLDRLKKALIKFENNTSYTNLLETLHNNCSSIIKSATNSAKSLCLCHGDIWKENILFKYKDSLPVSSCIIDYQTTRMCSPAFDVLYLIITSTTSSLRKMYFGQILDIYYQSFVATLECENLDSKLIYDREMLEYDLQIVGPTCFIIANTAIWLASGLQEEGHVRSKITFSNEKDKLNAIKQYKDIISEIIDDLLGYGYLSNVHSTV